jgi:hypothetical protein
MTLPSIKSCGSQKVMSAASAGDVMIGRGSATENKTFDPVSGVAKRRDTNLSSPIFNPFFLSAMNHSKKGKINDLWVISDVSIEPPPGLGWNCTILSSDCSRIPHQ